MALESAPSVCPADIPAKAVTVAGANTTSGSINKDNIFEM
jgi:hypothetical protein